MSYLSDYIFYNSGNECPRDFHIWSALVALSTIVGRKVWLDRKYFVIYPNIYVCLVGSPGSGKSVAKDISKYLILDHFPNVPLSASLQSREDILKKMSLPETARAFKLADGTYQEYRPFALYVNELPLFLSVDPAKMIGFLVDAFDARIVDSGFKKDVVQDRVENPYMTMCCCCPPDWMMRNLKMDLFSGGLGRRLIIVHAKKTKWIAEPCVPDGGDVAWKRVIEHLQQVKDFTGPMTFSPDGRDWFIKWYENKKANPPEDPILAQFYETKHVQLQKIAMLLALNELPLSRAITADNFKTALAMLDVLEPEIPKLSCGVGRNVLAPSMSALLDHIATAGGQMSEKVLLRLLSRDLRAPEFEEILKQLTITEQIKRAVVMDNGIPRSWIFLPGEYEKWQKKANEPKGSGESPAAPPA